MKSACRDPNSFHPAHRARQPNHPPAHVGPPLIGSSFRALAAIGRRPPGAVEILFE